MKQLQIGESKHTAEKDQKYYKTQQGDREKNKMIEAKANIGRGITIAAIAACTGCGEAPAVDQTSIEDLAKQAEEYAGKTNVEKEIRDDLDNSSNLDIAVLKRFAKGLTFVNLNNHRVFKESGDIKSYSKIEDEVLNISRKVGINADSLDSLNKLLGDYHVAIVKARQPNRVDFNYVAFGKIYQQNDQSIGISHTPINFKSIVLQENLLSFKWEHGDLGKIQMYEKGQILFNEKEAIYEKKYFDMMADMAWETCKAGVFVDQGGKNPRFDWLADMTIKEWGQIYKTTSVGSDKENKLGFRDMYLIRRKEDMDMYVAFNIALEKTGKKLPPIAHDIMSRGFQFACSKLRFKGIESQIINLSSRRVGGYEYHSTKDFIERFVFEIKKAQKDGMYREIESVNRYSSTVQQMQDVGKLSQRELNYIAKKMINQ
jgi:hypothetical protein